MCTHLSRRGARYYIRRVVPTDLIAHLGRREIVRSLGTSDRREGERLCRLEAVKLDHLFDIARQELKSLPLSEGIATRPDAAIQFAYDRWADGAREQNANEREDGYEARTPYREALLDLERDRNDAAEVARIRGGAATIRAVPPPTPNRIPQGQGRTSLGVVIDQWVAERAPLPKTIAAHIAVANWFHERIGRMPVEEISRADIMAFKASMIASGVSTPNVKSKLSRLSTLLNFAKNNSIIPSNPAAGVTVFDKVGDDEKRVEFSLEALAAIFTSPVYATDDRPPHGKGEAAYWLPILALYSGARLNELGQLRPGDIKQVPYVGADDDDKSAWVISLVFDAADGIRLKNKGSRRIIPIHPVLVSLGFIEYVEGARAAGWTRIFPELKANIYGTVTAKWSEWFSGHLRTVCGVTDKRMVFHSFRHTFSHYCRAAEVNDGVLRRLEGHSLRDISDKYGSGYTLHRLVQGMNLYRIPGFTPPAPPPAFRGPRK